MFNIMFLFFFSKHFCLFQSYLYQYAGDRILESGLPKFFTPVIYCTGCGGVDEENKLKIEIVIIIMHSQNSLICIFERTSSPRLSSFLLSVSSFRDFSQVVSFSISITTISLCLQARFSTCFKFT